MNKGLLIAIILILVIGIGAFALNQSGVKMENVDNEIVTEKTDGENMIEDEIMQEEEIIEEDSNSAGQIGSYEAYSPEKIAMAENGDVVLFFRASWCPTCRAVDSDIKANLDDIPSDLTILDVNYDDSSDLKQKYGVTYQHTFVQVDAEGNQIKKWTGSPTLASLVSEVQ